jgi:hypothetical protein
MGATPLEMELIDAFPFLAVARRKKELIALSLSNTIHWHFLGWTFFYPVWQDQLKLFLNALWTLTCTTNAPNTIETYR